MSNVVLLDTLGSLDDHELKIRLWEHQYAGDRGEAVQRIRAELKRRERGLPGSDEAQNASLGAGRGEC